MQITEAQLLAEMQHHVGQANGVHADELVRRITGQLVNTDMHTRRVRFLIKELRKQARTSAAPHGRLLHGGNARRAATHRRVPRGTRHDHPHAAQSHENIALPELLGQLRLPT